MRFIDLTGQRFGRLTVKKQLLDGRWRCTCDCGGEKVIQGMVLRAGKSRSCGCLRKELGIALGKSSRKHGHAADGVKMTSEYRAWSSMKSRCLNPAHKSYLSYGGRGIGVDPRWIDSFEAFFADMGGKPSPSHSIDRIDNALGYGPGNCRWATSIEQNTNTRGNRIVTVLGEKMTLSQALRRFGRNEKTFYNRIRTGMSEEESLLKPSRRGV